MASNNAQTSVPMPVQTSNIDKAITAIRQFQTGKADVAAVQAALAPLDGSALQWVSIGTRLPLGQLQLLRS